MSYVDHVIYKATRDAADWPHVTQWDLADLRVVEQQHG